MGRQNTGLRLRAEKKAKEDLGRGVKKIGSVPCRWKGGGRGEDKG